MNTQRKRFGGCSPTPDGDIRAWRRSWKVVLPSALVVAVLGLSLGVAYAFVTSSGSGTAVATTGSMQTVTIDAIAQDPSESLLPGATADATFAVDNPNPVAVTLVSVVQNGTISVSGGSGCTLADSGVTFANQTGLSISIPASTSDYDIDLLGAMSMASSSADGCQNATFSIPITITVQEG